MKWICGKYLKLWNQETKKPRNQKPTNQQTKKPPLPLNIPTPTPAPDRILDFSIFLCERPKPNFFMISDQWGPVFMNLNIQRYFKNQGKVREHSQHIL